MHLFPFLEKEHCMISTGWRNKGNDSKNSSRGPQRRRIWRHGVSHLWPQLPLALLQNFWAERSDGVRGWLVAYGGRWEIQGPELYPRAKPVSLPGPNLARSYSWKMQHAPQVGAPSPDPARCSIVREGSCSSTNMLTINLGRLPVQHSLSVFFLSLISGVR